MHIWGEIRIRLPDWWTPARTVAWPNFRRMPLHGHQARLRERLLDIQECAQHQSSPPLPGAPIWRESAGGAAWAVTSSRNRSAYMRHASHRSPRPKREASSHIATSLEINSVAIALTVSPSIPYILYCPLALISLAKNDFRDERYVCVRRHKSPMGCGEVKSKLGARRRAWCG